MQAIWADIFIWWTELLSFKLPQFLLSLSILVFLMPFIFFLISSHEKDISYKIAAQNVGGFKLIVIFILTVKCSNLFPSSPAILFFKLCLLYLSQLSLVNTLDSHWKRVLGREPWFLHFRDSCQGLFQPGSFESSPVNTVDEVSEWTKGWNSDYYCLSVGHKSCCN